MTCGEEGGAEINTRSVILQGWVWCAWEGLLAAAPPPSLPRGLLACVLEWSIGQHHHLSSFGRRGRCGGPIHVGSGWLKRPARSPGSVYRLRKLLPYSHRREQVRLAKGGAPVRSRARVGGGKALGLPHPPHGCFSCLLLGRLFICCWWGQRCCCYRPSLEKTAGYSPSQRLWRKGWLLGGRPLCSGRSLAGGPTLPAVPLRCCPPPCCLGCLRAPACWGLSPSEWLPA